HKLGYLTRHSWDYYDSYMERTGFRKLMLSHILFGDPSMDVWSAKAEKLVLHNKIRSGLTSNTKTFEAFDSSGNPVDALICILDENGNLQGKGISPFSYSASIGDSWLITANKANYIQDREYYFNINSYNSVPYSMGFEKGIDKNWTMKSSNSYGRIQVTSDNSPYDGEKHLTMDSKVSGQDVINEAWLHLNLTGKNRVMVEFQWKEFNDENNMEDGVFLSDNNGATFVKVYDLINGSSTWGKIVLDLDALATSNNLSYNRNFIVKFQQRDNYPIATDGFAFDDVKVYSNYATIPYSTGFEAGLDKYWTTSSDNQYGRVQITTANTPHSGSQHLTMDVSTNGHFATNEASLYLNLSSISSPELSFWWKDFSDENHASDGIYFSNDGGANFVKVYDLNGQSYANNSWQKRTLNIHSLATSHNLALSSKFIVKFQQYDNYMIATDGFAFDDISVVNGGGSTAKTLAEEDHIN
ncbi:MAG: hypothetical protein KAS49_02605, partial [Candidatus Cloacimonetes bacterium]|nr:hypothetical protein [Candidatus Cloacimonadota bacterium]